MLNVQWGSGEMEKDVINVYWAPFYESDGEYDDWSFLYPKPKNLFSTLIEKKNSDSGSSNFFACPAVSNKTKNIYVFSNALSGSYRYEGSEIHGTSENFISVTSERSPSIDQGPLFAFSLRYLLFADQPLDAYFTPPYFSKPEYTQYGSVMVGEFDIGRWFRPYNFEIQTWSNNGEIHLKENEPLFYVEFKTDKKIKMHRFKQTDQILKYSAACATTQHLFGKGESLIKKYGRFKDVGLKEKILMEIKANLLED
jgi:hypothetical protein